jgi:hypothetical protein
MFTFTTTLPPCSAVLIMQHGKNMLTLSTKLPYCSPTALLLLQHGKNINVDAWRLHQLAKATANPEHVWSHFFTGTLLTALQASLSQVLCFLLDVTIALSAGDPHRHGLLPNLPCHVVFLYFSMNGMLFFYYIFLDLRRPSHVMAALHASNPHFLLRRQYEWLLAQRPTRCVDRHPLQ